MLDTNRSVGALAAEHPRLRAVLEELGIDYCCSGNRNLADAAAAEGLPIQRVMEEIARSPEAAGPRGGVWLDKPLAQIVDHIADRHRAVSLESLARGAVLFELIAEAKLLDPELLEPMRHAFHELINELIPHSEREQRILFPYIESLEEAWERGTQPPPSFKDGLGAALAPVYLQHQTLNESLRRLRAGRALLACIDDPLCRRLAAHLQEVERDLHEAMNLENFVLYPRGIELEEQLLRAPVLVQA
jgi:regulator of cell morphogenesis and NO signaling